MNWKEQAQELFGSHWKVTVAVLMGVSKRAVQYWANGTYKIEQSTIEKINATYKIWKELKKKTTS